MIISSLIAIMLMRVLQSLFSKKTALSLPDGLMPYISYIALSKLLAALFAVAMIVPTMNFSGVNAQGVLIAACSGTCLAIGSVCGIKAMLGGTIVLNTLFSTAGMIIPIIIGQFTFNEPVSFMQWLCIVVLFLGIFLMVSSTKSTFKGFSLKTLWFLVGSFVSNGLVMYCQKLFGEVQPEGNVSMFSMFTFLIPAVVMYIIFFGMKISGKGKDSKPLPKKVILYAVVLAFAVFVIQQLVTLLTPKMSAAVLFTILSGGTTVIAAVVGAVAYKERITAKSALGIILGLASLTCIKIFN